MSEYVTDMIGNVVEVGDQIVYGRSKGDTLHFGEVADVFPETNSIKVRNKDTGRISVNKRNGNRFLVITFLKDTNPEFFI